MIRNNHKLSVTKMLISVVLMVAMLSVSLLISSAATYTDYFSSAGTLRDPSNYGYLANYSVTLSRQGYRNGLCYMEIDPPSSSIKGRQSADIHYYNSSQGIYEYLINEPYGSYSSNYMLINKFFDHNVSAGRTYTVSTQTDMKNSDNSVRALLTCSGTMKFTTAPSATFTLTTSVTR